MANTIKLRDVNPVVLNHRLGLGQPNPSERLVVAEGSIRLETDGTGEGIQFHSFSSTASNLGLFWTDHQSNSLWKLQNDENQDPNSSFKNDLVLRNGAGDTVLRVTQDGKIGWGVDALPVSHFHIGGALGGEIRLTNSSVGDTSSDGGYIKAGTDKHFYIDCVENTGGIKLLTQGNVGLFVDSNSSVSVGGQVSVQDPDSRFVIYKANIAGSQTEGLLHLFGKFDQSNLDHTDRLGIRTTFQTSAGVGPTHEPIRFMTDGTNTFTLINQDAGKVGIGAGVSAPSSTLHIAQGGPNVISDIRISAEDADAYLSFGDNNKDWYVGIDQGDSSKFKIGLGSGAPASVGSINIDPANNRVGIRDTGPSHTLTVSGDFKVWGDDSGTARGIILSYSNGNDSGIIDTTNSSTHLEFRVGNVTKGWLTTTGYLLVGSINASTTWGSDAALEVDGPILAKGGTTSSAGFLFRGDSNTGMLNSGANTLDFFTAGLRRLQILNNGNITVGANKIAPVKHNVDAPENSIDVSVKTSVSHADDAVLYSVSLDDINEDDVLMVTVNWGYSNTNSYSPQVGYGVILADNSTRTYASAQSSEFIKMLAIQEYMSGPATNSDQSKSMSISYKVTADDFTDARNEVNFVVYAYSSLAAAGDTLTFNTSGRMTVTQIKSQLVGGA